MILALCVCAVIVASGLIGDVCASHIKQIYNIVEGEPVGFIIGNLTADLLGNQDFRTLYDVTDLSDVTFKLLTTSRVSVTLQPGTDILYVSGDIDRETLCPRQEFCDLRIDVYMTIGREFIIIKIYFYVHDRNDNNPRFAQDTFSKTLIETTPVGTNITLPYAEDRDSPKFGVTEYQLHDNSGYFRLHISSNSDSTKDVLLRLAKPLDFESQRVINLTLLAFDGGNPRRSGVLHISVLVADANDHVPVFDRPSYDRTVPEDVAVGTTLTRVRARDADSGLNSVINYSFSPRTRSDFGAMFAIHNGTGDVTVTSPLDFEQHQLIDLVVTAQDLGVNSHSSDVTLSVRVTDVNDCAPQVVLNALNANGAWSASVLEGVDAGTFVALLSVSDEDSPQFADVECELTEASASLFAFSLQPTSSTDRSREYQLVTSRVFDREVREHFEVQLHCTDSKLDGANEVVQSLQLLILDVNDNNPRFGENRYVAHLQENNEPGCDVILVNASDRDVGENARLVYRIISDDTDAFQIDHTSGLIQALRTLDFEDRAEYEFKVKVEDGGHPPRAATCEVVVQVTDLNDRPPVFQQSVYHFNVSEGERGGAFVGFVRAVDADAAPFNEVHYSIDPSDRRALRYFTIDSYTGELRTKQAIDRENTRKFNMQLTAHNPDAPTLHSLCTASVVISDVNDNAPRFLFPSARNNTVQVAPEVEEGFAVARLIAKDDDAGVNAEVTYILHAGSNMFEVDGSSGVIVARRNLKLIDGNRFKLSVQVRDSGTPSLHDDATLVVLVNKSQGVITSRDKTPATVTSHSFLPAFLSGLAPRIILLVSCSAAGVVVLLIIAVVCVFCHRGNSTDSNDISGSYSNSKTVSAVKYSTPRRRDDTLETLHDADVTTDSLSKRARSLSLELDVVNSKPHSENSIGSNHSSLSETRTSARFPVPVKLDCSAHRSAMSPRHQSMQRVSAAGQVPPPVPVPAGIMTSQHLNGSLEVSHCWV